jgi:hypothetical protein
MSATTVNLTKVVVPRVIPMFVHDVETSSLDRRLAHLDLLHDHTAQVFAARCEPSDVLELIECLIRQCRPDHAGLGETTLQGAQALRLRAIRCLARLFADAEAYTPRTYQAVRAIAARLGTERAQLRDARASEFERQVRAIEAEKQEREAAKEEAKKNQGAEKSTESDAASASLASPTVASQSIEPATQSGGRQGSPSQHAAEPNDEPPSEIDAPLPDDPVALQDHALCLDASLKDLVTRGVVLDLFRRWDSAMIDVSVFTESPQTLHASLPHRLAAGPRVYRDFVTCTRRPKLTKPWGPASYVHIKTNIKAQSDIMYRFVIEGYNYGVNAAIFSDVVGCTNRRWKEIGNMTQYGWPEGWDAAMTNDYAPGCAISQYYSRDRYLVLRLKAKSFFSVGFTVSAWLIFHGYGEGFLVAATIHHQDEDL